MNKKSPVSEKNPSKKSSVVKRNRIISDIKPSIDKNGVQKRKKTQIIKPSKDNSNEECIKLYAGEYTWLEIMKHPQLKQDTKLVAVNEIHNRIAYLTKMYNLLSIYLDSKKIPYKKPYQQTWKYYTDKLYKNMLERRRKLANMN